MPLLWCVTRGCLIQLTDTAKVRWKGLARRNEKLMCFWEHLVPPFQRHFKTLLLPTQHLPWLPTVCRAVLLHHPWPYLSIWDCGVTSLTALGIISLSPHWAASWSPSKSLVTTGIFNSITRCSDVCDTNIYARALKLGQLLLLSIKDKLNLELTLPSRQRMYSDTSYP